MQWLTFRDVYFNTVDIVVSAANDDVIVYSNRRWKYVPGKFEWTKGTTTPCTENIHIATCRAGTDAWNIVLRCALWSVILDLDVVVTWSGVHLRIQFCFPFQSKVFIPAVDALVMGPWVYPRVVQCTAFHHATGWEHGLVCGRLSYLCVTKQRVSHLTFCASLHSQAQCVAAPGPPGCTWSCLQMKPSCNEDIHYSSCLNMYQGVSRQFKQTESLWRNY